MKQIMNRLISLTLGIVIFLSSCSPQKLQQATSLTLIPLESTTTPTPTIQTITTPIAEDISNSIIVNSQGTNSIQITNLSLNRTLKIFRRFTNQEEMISELKPQEKYIDQVAWDGSDYYYRGEDDWGNRTNEVRATTDLKDSTKERGLLFKWEPVAKSLGWDTSIKPESEIYSYLVHGVMVRMIYEKECVSRLSENQMFQYAMTVAHLFDYNWQLYEAFPLDEYRHTCSDYIPDAAADPSTNPSHPTYNTLGMFVNINQLTSGQIGISYIDQVIMHGQNVDFSHAISHAWQGPLFNLGNPGLMETINQYNCVVTALPHSLALNMLSDYLTSTRDIKDPLYPNANDGGAWAYFKGAFLTYKISVKLLDEAGLTYNQFMKWGYDHLYLNQKNPGSVVNPNITSPQELLKALNDFSGLDFSDLFNDDVFETTPINKDFPLDEKYLPVFLSACGKPDTYNQKYIHQYKTLELISPSDGVKMEYVPAGKFQMGELSYGGYPEVSPEHTVDLDAFWIDQTEVTNEMYEKCVTDGPCTAPSKTSSSTRADYYSNNNFESFPVVNVTWEQSQQYCNWAGKRLPTEAEWEKTTRGLSWMEFNWGENGFYKGIANINANNDTTEVGSYLQGSSPYGTLDMIGNVKEWVADWYASDYYKNSPSDNPIGPEIGETRVLRGGAFNSGSPFWLIARENKKPNEYGIDIGFRCAVSHPFGLEINPIDRATLTPTLTITPGPSPTSTPTITLTITPTVTITPVPGAIQIISRISPKDGMTQLFVPEGEFMAGSKQGVKDPHPIELLHTIYLDDFWIDQTEVTNAMYQKCIEAGACAQVILTYDWIPDYQTDYPVRGVSWYMARDYCRWVGRSLPTIAQWEKAARGNDTRMYPWGNQEPNITLAQWGTG